MQACTMQQLHQGSWVEARSSPPPKVLGSSNSELACKESLLPGRHLLYTSLSTGKKLAATSIVLSIIELAIVLQSIHTSVRFTFTSVAS